MEFQPISLDDLALLEAIYCDPVMMQYLGGPFPKERIPKILSNVVDSIERDEAWVFKVIPDNTADQAAGVISIWKHDEDGEPINEIGWTVLPPFQGRGLATTALRTILERARAEQRFTVIDAFPGVDNLPSNALCRKFGFSLVRELDLDYAGRMLRCNHWRIDLRKSEPSE